MLFDTHTHLDDERFNEDRDELIKRIHAEGVSYILNAAADPGNLEQVVELSGDYDFIYSSVGVHPHNASEVDEAVIEKMRQLAKSPKVVAVGEIGLDFYYDTSPRDVQKYWFARQINLAKELSLPIIVHDRDAHEETMNIIKAEKARDVGGVFHCYSGSVEMARAVLNNNFYISVGGVITFKNAKKAIEVVKYVPLDRLLIETDCPYLTPEPFRGKRNDPGLVRLVAQKLAEIKGITFEEAAMATLENGKRLFRIK